MREAGFYALLLPTELLGWSGWVSLPFPANAGLMKGSLMLCLPVRKYFWFIQGKEKKKSLYRCDLKKKALRQIELDELKIFFTGYLWVNLLPTSFQ